MRKILPLSVFLFVIIISANAQQRCASAQHDTLMGKRYKNWVIDRKRLIDSVNAHLRMPFQRAARTAACEVVKIPVVIHVVHNNTSGAIGGSSNPNITDAQIQNQIRILNEDYRRKTGTRGARSPLGTDTGIEFFLAKVAPDGSTTTGITRHIYTAQADFDINTDDKVLANIVSWPSDKYLNIWVAKYKGDFLGIGQFPSVAGVVGLDEDNALLDKTDGIFVDYRVFGIGSPVTTKLYNAGRTTTHEIGHWLGLIHTWGDTFCGNDYCDDVPIAERGNNGFTCGPIYSNCNGTRTQNMTENYMDYSPDTCMSVFTSCQVARMRAVLEKSPRRAKLMRAACAQLPSVDSPYIDIAPNPVTTNDVTVNVYIKDFANYDVELYDLAGRKVFGQNFTNYPSWAISIPVDNLANGTYIVSVKLPNQKISKKVIISR